MGVFAKLYSDAVTVILTLNSIHSLHSPSQTMTGAWRTHVGGSPIRPSLLVFKQTPLRQSSCPACPTSTSSAAPSLAPPTCFAGLAFTLTLYQIQAYLARNSSSGVGLNMVSAVFTNTSQTRSFSSCPDLFIIIIIIVVFIAVGGLVMVIANGRVLKVSQS